MNKFRNILLLLLGLTLSLGATAQTIVTGSNLNIGTNNTLNSNRGNAIGTDHWLGSYHSLAVGNNDTILNNGNSSVALGSMNRIDGLISAAIGADIKINGNKSVGIGHDLKLSGISGCMIIGNGIMGSGVRPNVSLENSYSDCLMIGLHSTKPTITVSSSPNDYPNGTILNRTGKVAIGDIPVSDIAAKLHIRSDEGEDAGIFLQPTKEGTSFINLTDYNHQILVKEDGSMHVTAFSDDLNLSGTNANLSGNAFTLGYSGNRKFYATTQGNPAIYSNAYRTSNGCFRYTQGPSYAIEFNNNVLLFRTAVYQQPLDPRGTEITNWRDALLLKTNGAITLNGKVGINTENTTSAYALAVDGGLITTKVYIQDVEDWSDYVFDDTYKLMPLHELKKYIGDNKHLPEIPSESEIVRQGYDLHEMQSAMMKKIEELTLYTLQQQEEIETLRKMVDELKGK